VAWAMVTLAPPELVRVSDSVWLLPTCTLPKLRLEAVAVSDPCVTPEPESGTVMTEIGLGLDLLRRSDGITEALVITDIIPFWFPLAVGAKVTLKFVVWPAGKMIGRLVSATWNPLPLTMTCETVRSIPPELMSLADLVCLFPRSTLLKLMGDGTTVSWPALTANPDKDTVTGVDAVLEMAIVPEGFPAC
jgi:hypothetical protein